MNVLIAGGTGMIGTRLTQSLLADGHQVWVLGRQPKQMRLPAGVQALGWDGHSTDGWGRYVSEMEAVVNLAGATVSRWPWTPQWKNRILSSRVQAGQAMAKAIESASPRPKVLIQSSGIGHYGSREEWGITEDFPAGNDFFAEVTKQWETSSRPVETMGVRRVVIRTALVLAPHAGIFPLMTLPVRCFVGGPYGMGRQGISWIHLDDEVGAIRFLMEQSNAVGAYNLAAPNPASNAEFIRVLAKVLHRPYWLPAPAFALRLALGEMSTLLLDGQFALPKRLTDQGYAFKFPELQSALQDLFS